MADKGKAALGKVAELKEQVNQLTGGTLTEVEDARGNYTTLSKRLDTEALLSVETIDGTTQKVTFNTDMTVQNIQHIDGVGVVVRNDIFTYADGKITEVRTLSTSETKTLIYEEETE